MIYLREKQEKQICTLQIEKELYKEVKKQCKQKEIFFRDAVEFGLKVFLEQQSKGSKK